MKSSKRLIELEQRQLEISRETKLLEDKMKQREKFASKEQYDKILIKEYLKEIIKLTEQNNYNNEKLIFRKVKELAKTAINI